MRALILFCLLPVIVFAQSYFEASGQTVAFTLTAGAKAGWNPGISVEKPRVMAAPPDVFRISWARNGLYVHAGAKGIIKLFDMRGRMITSLKVERDGFIGLTHYLANGIFAARFEAPGKTVRTAKLAVVR